MNPTSDTSIFRAVNAEQEPVTKTRLQFFLASQYRVQERHSSANAVMREAEENGIPGLIETRLAKHDLDAYRDEG